MGTAAWPGAFAEYVLVPEASVFPLPQNLSFVQGSLIEPLTIAVHVVRRAGLKPKEAVAVLGAGSIGGLVCGVCKAGGASPIIAADIRQHCLDTAQQHLGADPTILLPDDELVTKVMDITSGAGVDVVFVTADDVRLVNAGIAMTKRRGRIVLVSLMTEAPVQFSAYQIISKELEIIGSTMSTNDDVQRAIGLAASAQVDVAAIARHLLPFDQVQRGMQLARTKDDGAIKVVLSFDS
jgi:L-iditol 2-dehydrogenase